MSFPAIPENALALALPRIVSASAVPMTSSIPVPLDSVSVSPATSDCAIVAARSSETPPLERPEKSSESASASAPSTIVTVASSVPVKT